MFPPFPGMDPYLEHPALWPDVHNSLIAAIRDSLSPRVAPRYVVRLEERTYVAEPWGLEVLGRPDALIVDSESPAPRSAEGARESGGVKVEVLVPDEVRETWLEVRAAESSEVVTVLEVLSPTNKIPGEGRRRYEEKRLRVLGTRTHLVEIDLVRTGDPMSFRGTPEIGDYRILVSRGDRRPSAMLYAFSLKDPIPKFVVPLRAPDPGPDLDLGTVLRGIYDRARYDLSIDYGAEPVPPLASEDDRAWLDRLLRGASVRTSLPKQMRTP
jgi:hypothetical protein